MKAICEVKFKLIAIDYGVDGRCSANRKVIGIYDNYEDIPKKESDAWTTYCIEQEAEVLERL